MVDLTRIDLATEDDKLHGIDLWASFFKATTWEELKMLAHNNDDIQEAVATVYQLTQEERIRQQCEAREDYYRRQRDVNNKLKEYEETNKQLVAENRQLAAENRQLADKINLLTNKMEQLTNKLDQLQALAENLQEQSKD